MHIYRVSKRKRIKFRIRKKIFGLAEAPRLTVYRSNKAIYAQLIDDDKGHTLLSASTQSTAVNKKTNKTEQAKEVGKLLAEQAKSKGIVKCTFDRNGYLYHGRVKALADGAREGGLAF